MIITLKLLNGETEFDEHHGRLNDKHDEQVIYDESKECEDEETGLDPNQHIYDRQDESESHDEKLDIADEEYIGKRDLQKKILRRENILLTLIRTLIGVALVYSGKLVLPIWVSGDTETISIHSEALSGAFIQIGMVVMGTSWINGASYDLRLWNTLYFDIKKRPITLTTFFFTIANLLFFIVLIIVKDKAYFYSIFLVSWIFSYYSSRFFNKIYFSVPTDFIFKMSNLEYNYFSDVVKHYLVGGWQIKRFAFGLFRYIIHHYYHNIRY